MAEEEKSPVSYALDALVYLPVGLALTLRDELPQLTARGRATVGAQLNIAKMIGQFAVSQGQREATKFVEQAGAVASRLGGAAAPVVPPAAAPTSAPVTTPMTSSPAPATNGSTASRNGNGAERSNGRPRPAGPPVSSLAIPGYDTLSASQVVTRLAGLSAVELDAVRSYEEANRGRRTILSKVTQLEADRT